MSNARYRTHHELVHNFSRYRNLEFRNNIFFIAVDSLALFRIVRANDIPPEFQYNLLYGFHELFWNNRGVFEIDTTNVFADPLFVSLDSSDFHLLADSPCIDAGDPGSPLDPDGTRADIGAFHFPQEQFIPEMPQQIPVSLELVSSYPNPFNNHTCIHYSLPILSEVKLTIHDLAGREVTVLKDGVQGAGNHSIAWNPVDVPAGLYVCRLEARDRAVSMKMALVK